MTGINGETGQSSSLHLRRGHESDILSARTLFAVETALKKLLRISLSGMKRCR